MLKPQRFGRYILLDRLSTGGMAEVFLAKSSGLEGFEKVLAIKRILPSVSEDSDFTTMFIDEAKISANLAHANIGQVFEFGQANGQYYIAMEYIPGRDLRAINNHLMDTGRLVEVPMALHIATRLCQGLDYAHRQKNTAGVSMEIVHRDVSPPNVIITYDGTVKLIDFGIAKAASRATRTRAGKLKGKFSYMSPEQVQGLPVDRRSDVFSLGIVLHELLTGGRLFHGENQLATLNLVRRAEVAPPSTVNPEVPLEVDRIVLKALARDREERYGWATELRADIERFLARNGIVFDGLQLSQWMHAEFAGEIEADRLMRERIHGLQLEDVPEAEPPVEEADDEGFEGAPTRDAPSILGARRSSPAAVETRAERPLPTTSPMPRPLPYQLEGTQPADDVAQRLERDELDVPPIPGLPSFPVSARRTPAPIGPQAPAEIHDAPTVTATVPPQVFVVGEPGEDEHELMTAVGLVPRHKTARDESLPETLQLPSLVDPELPPAERTDEVVLIPPDSPQMLVATDTNPRVLGPDAARQDEPLAHASTRAADDLDDALLDEGEDEGEDLAATINYEGSAADELRGGAIAPGADRDAASVGGALESGGQDRPPPSIGDEARVDLTGLGPIAFVESQPDQRLGQGPPSGTRQVPSPGLGGLKVALIAGGATLLLAGILFAVLATGRSSDPVEEGGTVVVTTNPRQAACSVSLDLNPKGLLQPEGSLTLHGVTPGRRIVSLECVGFQRHDSTIEVKAAQTSIFVAPLLKNR